MSSAACRSSTARAHSPRSARTRARQVPGGPLVPAVAGPPAGLERPRGERVGRLQVAVPEVQDGFERVRDPGRLRVGHVVPRGLDLPARRVAAPDPVRDLLAVGDVADVRQAQWPLEVGLRLVGRADAPGELALDVGRHEGQEGPPMAIGGVERPLEDVEALAQSPPDECMPAVRLGRTRPQQLVADRFGDLHPPPGGLEAGLDAQAVGECGRDADLQVSAGPPRRPLPEDGTSGVEVAEGAADVEVVRVDGVHQRERHSQARMDPRRALGVPQRRRRARGPARGRRSAGRGRPRRP